MIKDKTQKFQKQFRSQERRKIFNQERKKLLQAIQFQNYSLVAQTQLQMMKLFDSRQQYEMIMKYAEDYERAEAEYLQFMQRLEQESINFEQLQREKIMKEKRAELEQYFKHLQSQDV